jgi:enterochelin esterase-like enzyme
LSYNSPIAELPRVAAQLRAAGTTVWAYCGRQDYDVIENEHMSAELVAEHIPQHFILTSGGHTWALWRSMMASAFVAASKGVRGD